jgi:hypothetical protein
MPNFGGGEGKTLHSDAPIHDSERNAQSYASAENGIPLTKGEKRVWIDTGRTPAPAEGKRGILLDPSNNRLKRRTQIEGKAAHKTKNINSI